MGIRGYFSMIDAPLAAAIETNVQSIDDALSQRRAQRVELGKVFAEVIDLLGGYEDMYGPTFEEGTFGDDDLGFGPARYLDRAATARCANKIAALKVDDIAERMEQHRALMDDERMQLLAAGIAAVKRVFAEAAARGSGMIFWVE